MKKLLILFLLAWQYCSSQNLPISGYPTASDINSAFVPIAYPCPSCPTGYTTKKAPTSLFGAVISFNSRTGAITPQSSDYSSFYLQASNNLSDLISASTARTNLGLGSLAVLNSINNSNWSGTALAHSNIAATAVTPGSYTNANITIAADGSITAASNGSGGGVSSFNSRTGAVMPQSSDYSISQISGLGTGTATALGINVGSSGAVVTNGGALGTPSSGTLTNATGLPISGLTGLGSGVNTWLSTPTVTNLGTALGSQSANTFLAAPDGVSGNISTRSITRRDLSNAYTQVGQIFTEPWTNLTNWGNVGTPSASVSGGFLNLGGTASTSTNYIKNTSYGKFNLESAQITWTEVVGTIGASTSGIGFGLVSQNTLSGTSFANSMMVNIELSNSGTGSIKWYFGSGTTFTVAQTSPALLVPNTGDVLNIILTVYPDKYELAYNINGGLTTHDTFVAYTGPAANATYTNVVHNAAAFSFLNVGGGNSHKVGPITVKSLHNKNADILLIGNSIFSGFGCTNMYYRAATKLQERTYTTVEINARPSNSVLDINVNEIAAYNATKLILLASSNDVAVNGAATAETNLATILTSLAGISNTAAPSGYSIANGNLVIGTELQRVAAIATYNTDITTTYGAANLINFNAIGNDGASTAMPIPSATGALAYSWDAVHPNDYTNGLMADEIIRYFGFIRKDVYRNEDAPILNIPSTRGWNTFLNMSSGITIMSSMNSNREKYLSFSGYGTTNTGAMTAAIRASQAGGENVILGQTTVGFGIWANSAASGTYAATKRFTLDYSGNISTGNTTSVIYRTTNGGGNVSAHLMIDPSSSLTSGNALAYDNTNGLMQTIANGTLRVATAATNITDKVTTAGAETNSFNVYVKPAGSAMVQRQVWMGKETTLTESTATAFARITLTAGQYTGGEITVVVQANDGTDFQAVTSRFAYSAVMKSTTVTASIETPVQTTSVSTGTLTVTITAVDSGSGNLDFKANAVSSLTQTSLQAQCYMTKNYLGTITAQ